MKKPKVLIVDDEKVCLDVLEYMLESKGCEVFLATDGVQALECLKENSDIKLIMLDLMMPVMSGLDLLKKIRNIDEFNDVVVVIQSGTGERHDIEEAFSLGAISYIRKPYEKSSVMQVVEKALDLNS